VGECSFWYRPTRVVPDQRPLNGRCCHYCPSSVNWLRIDRAAWFQAISNSSVGHAPSPSLTANNLFAQYDSELRAIADRLAPAREVNSRVRPQAPWFDAECRATRRQCRKLERRYRRTRIDADCVAFCDAVRSKHAAFAATKNALLLSAATPGSSGGHWRTSYGVMTHQHCPPPLLLLTTSSTFLTRR